MPSIQETAYPRLKSAISQQDLIQVYTPTPEELALAHRSTKGEEASVGFLVLLKTFQRLGYFVPLAEVPPAIVAHIAQSVGRSITPRVLKAYDRSGTRARHLSIIRTWQQVESFGEAADKAMLTAMREAAQTKDEPADIINVAIEELVRQRFELPVFPTLNRAAQHARRTIKQAFYQQVAQALNEATRTQLDALFAVTASSSHTAWNALRQDAGNPTLTHLKELIVRQGWLAGLAIGREGVAGIPEAKVKHFAAEAHTLDAARMQAMESHKRYTLAVALIAIQSARTLDDLAEMFVKQMASIHRKGSEALAVYRTQHQQHTDELVATLRDLVVAYRTTGPVKQRLAAVQTVIGNRDEQILEQCDAHLAYAGNNYLPFLWKFYKSHRAALFDWLHAMTLRSTSQDITLESAVQFVLQHERRAGDWLPTVEAIDGEEGQSQFKPLLDLAWVLDTWWRLVSEQSARLPFPQRVNRRHFEVCLFAQLMWELKSGDLFIAGSDQFADYRAQQISWE